MNSTIITVIRKVILVVKGLWVMGRLVGFGSKFLVRQVQVIVHQRFMINLMGWVVKTLITFTLKSILALVVTGFLVNFREMGLRVEMGLGKG